MGDEHLLRFLKERDLRYRQRFRAQQREVKIARKVAQQAAEKAEAASRRFLTVVSILVATLAVLVAAWKR